MEGIRPTQAELGWGTGYAQVRMTNWVAKGIRPTQAELGWGTRAFVEREGIRR